MYSRLARFRLWTSEQSEEVSTMPHLRPSKLKTILRRPVSKVEE